VAQDLRVNCSPVRRDEVVEVTADDLFGRATVQCRRRGVATGDHIWRRHTHDRVVGARQNRGQFRAPDGMRRLDDLDHVALQSR
jgi:hypothetical protein